MQVLGLVAVGYSLLIGGGCKYLFAMQVLGFLFPRWMSGFAQSDRHPTAEPAEAAIDMAVVVRGSDVAGVICHDDKGCWDTSDALERACGRLESWSC